MKLKVKNEKLKVQNSMNFDVVAGFVSAHGITLISLVITIIILIILAGVAMYFTLGNNGILNKAEQAKNETIKQTATEKMNLKITNMQIEKYAEEQRMPTLQEFADGLCEDDEIQYVQLESKKVGSLSKIEVGEAESIFTKLKEYPYEFEINSSLQLASIDGIQIATNDTVTIPKEEYEELKDANLYSTTEKKIGTWIDGRSLYRKVLYAENLVIQSNTDYSYDVTNLLDNSNIEVVNIDGGYYMDYGTAYQQFHKWSYSSDNFYYTVYYRQCESAIKIRGTWGGLQYTIDKAYFIIEYVKNS